MSSHHRSSTCFSPLADACRMERRCKKMAMFTLFRRGPGRANRTAASTGQAARSGRIQCRPPIGL
jgi:hypothetical protein